MFIWSWSEHRAVLCIVSKSASFEYFATCYCPQAKLSRGDTRVAGLHSPQEVQSSSAAAGEEEESPLWISCIINYLHDATSCYLHWTDGNAV